MRRNIMPINSAENEALDIAEEWHYRDKSATYEPEDKRAYRIVVNHEELFESKTRKMVD